MASYPTNVTGGLSQAELDGSFEGFKREFDKTVRGAFYDTKLIAQR